MTVVELVNLGLLKIGHTKTITAITDNSREVLTATAVYDTTLRATLRRFPWPFATKYAVLALTQGRAWATTATVQAWSATQTYAVGDVVALAGTFYYCILAHTNHTPPNATYWSLTATVSVVPASGDWQYSYRWPVDCLFARRMVPAKMGLGGGRAFDPSPIPFRVGRDVNGLLLYTNEAAALLEYTAIDCDALWTDDIWICAFTWRLGAEMAPGLARDAKVTAGALQMAEYWLAEAAVVAAREGQPDKLDADAEWIRAR